MKKKNNKYIDFSKAIDKNALKKAMQNEKSKNEIMNILKKVRI